MAANYLCKTVNPENPNGPKIDAVFPAEYTAKLFKFWPVDYQNLRAAKYVLENVERIFFGVRDFNEGGWCFTARPKDWYIRERIEVPFPKDKLFAVYLNPRMYVYECRAEFVADDDSFCPVDWQTRYRGLTWRKNTS